MLTFYFDCDIISQMKYFEVRCKQGHCGTGRYRTITFYFQAKYIFKAQQRARFMPSVKHNKITCIISAKEINKQEYL